MRWQWRLFMEIEVFICPNLSRLLRPVRVHLHLASFLNFEWCLGAILLHLAPVTRGVCKTYLRFRATTNTATNLCRTEGDRKSFLLESLYIDWFSLLPRTLICSTVIPNYFLAPKFLSSTNPNFVQNTPTLISFKTQLPLPLISRSLVST